MQSSTIIKPIKNIDMSKLKGYLEKLHDLQFEYYSSAEMEVSVSHGSWGTSVSIKFFGRDENKDIIIKGFDFDSYKTDAENDKTWDNLVKFLHSEESRYYLVLCIAAD